MAYGYDTEDARSTAFPHLLLVLGDLNELGAT